MFLSFVAVWIVVILALLLIDYFMNWSFIRFMGRLEGVFSLIFLAFVLTLIMVKEFHLLRHLVG